MTTSQTANSLGSPHFTRNDPFVFAVESAPCAMFVMNEDGRILLANALAEVSFGYTRHELTGQLVGILVPERFRSEHEAFFAEFVKAPKLRAIGGGRDFLGRRKDGSEFPIEIGLSPIPTAEGVRILAAITDVTERK